MGIRKRITALTLCLAIIFTVLFASGCQLSGEQKPKEWMSFDYFDTFTVFSDYSADGDAAFRERRDKVEEVFELYNSLFDIYSAHDGVTGLYEINKNAGGEAVTVCPELIEFLEYCVELYEITGGEVNIAMGSLLGVWHEYREGGVAIPTENELAEAARHTGIDNLVIDKENMTVRLKDSKASLDVGAIGKGYAVEKAAQALIAMGAEGCVIDGGGNLRAIGSKSFGRGWTTAITNPKAPLGADYSYKLTLKNKSIATSGDYQRYYTVDGVKYHHIIDGETLMPGRNFVSVSVMCDSAALADGLSTALFLMSYDEGVSLADSLGVDALWITPDGQVLKTDGMK